MLHSPVWSGPSASSPGTDSARALRLFCTPGRSGVKASSTRAKAGSTRETGIIDPSLSAGAGFDTEAALTGTFQVSLTRAVLPYREVGEQSLPGGRLADIGLGVVVDGSDPARADVVDLGSAEIRVVDLTGPLVVLGWLYPSGLRSLRRVVEDTGFSEMDRTRAFTFSMALRALNSAGFGPLTRPTILRIGFRDLCQDLDLHEGTAIRLLLPSGNVARVHLDYETVTLVARAGGPLPNRELESALVEAFGGRELLRGSARDPLSVHAYYLPLPIPRGLEETRRLLDRLRRGFVHLLARFEPERYRSLRDLTGALGERDSLRSLQDRMEVPRLETIIPAERPSTGVSGVH